jgi:hypothetical protein
MKINVVPIGENYRGLTYGQWASIWAQWLFSDNPDNHIRPDILFLRGNMDYKSVGGPNTPRFLDKKATLDRTAQYGEAIYENVAILIPVLTAQLSIGDIHDGIKIKNEQQLRDAVNKETDESIAMWATIKNIRNKRSSKIVHDLNEYRTEPPPFRLSVPESSVLRERAENLIEPGDYYTVIGGYFLLVRSMNSGKYRIQFGGEGRGNYSTNAVYDIEVLGKRKNLLKDKSGSYFYT